MDPADQASDAAGAHPENLGAYALNALDPAEAEAVRRHTADCHDCGRQLVELVEAKGALDRVPLEALLDISPNFA